MKSLFSLSWPVSIISLLLLSFGILVIFSSSVELALQQLVFATAGIFIFFIVSQIDSAFFQKTSKFFYFITFILLIIVEIVGLETRGSVRWIPLGIFNIQPSEFAKPVLIIFFANFWFNHRPTWINIFKSFLWFSPLAFLIFKQPDLGSALTVSSIWLGLLIASGISVKKIITLVLITLICFPAGWLSLQEYQKLRIISFIAPGSDPLGTGYNQIQSTIAVGSGQIFGRGLGRGTQSRLQFLPEFRTDFIFAAIAEETGFLGSMIIVSFYFLLLLYLLKLSEQVVDTYGIYIILGVVFMFIFQVIINIGMNIGILPITGITLPLISYGGSSLISTCLCLGLCASVLNTVKRIPKEDVE